MHIILKKYTKWGNYLRVVTIVPEDFVISFDDEELRDLSETEKNNLISVAVKEIVSEQVNWIEIKEKVAIS